MIGFLPMIFGWVTKAILTNTSASKTSGDPTDARAGFRLNTSGDAQKGTGTTSVTYSNITGEWLVSGFSASDFECRATVQSGDNPTTGTLNTWEALSSTRTWEQIQTSVGSRSGVLLIEIREAATGYVHASASVTLSVTVNSP